MPRGGTIDKNKTIIRDAELYLVGATARDVVLRLLKVSVLPQRTLDVDVAIALKDWFQ